MLSKRVGIQNIEAVEDAVQAALIKALETWTKDVPENPSAWLYRVAYNNLIEGFRRQKTHLSAIEKTATNPIPSIKETPSVFFTDEMQSDLLLMLFHCCDDAISAESQLVFALKVLCGFSISEIAIRLFTTEANIYKRFSRARNTLKKNSPSFDALNQSDYRSRIPAMHTILYLLFTEGYLSSHATQTIRRELCEEAIRLTTLLTQHSSGQNPETFALLALMHLHLARMSARQDGSGLLLLEEQNRDLWEQQEIKTGLYWLAQSSQGDSFSRYHAEAGIAAEHCLADSFEDTRWDRIVECYSLLERVSPSAIHKLNCAVAIAEWLGPEKGLEYLNNFIPPTWLKVSYMWPAVLMDLNMRCGNTDKAKYYKETAFELSPNQAIKNLLLKRFNR